ncbi:MAG: hypothetical protein HZB57_05515, partial [Gammaproteobacteria bacterium]|nr:hypothetical protein [Gammaproteobacteria bacterium]
QDSSEGIYLDDFTNGVEVAWNTVINAHYGIQGNSPSNNNIHNNTLFGSRKSQINLNATVGNTSPNAVYNNQVNNNVVFSLSSEPTYELDSKFDSTAQFCAADNNNYSSMYTPIHSREQLQNWTIINDYTYAQWRQTTLRDQNSTMFDTFGISPTRVSSYSGNNLLLNPNFDANTTSWSCDSGTSACLSYVSACASGGACLGYTVTLSSGSDTYSDFRQTNINIQKDVEYLVEFDMHAGRDGTLTSFAIMHNQSPYENLGFSKKVTAGTQWKSYSYTFKANATQMALMNFNLGTNVGDYIEVDNFRLEPVTLQYNDPSDDAKIVVNKTNAVMDMYCEDSGSDPARCGDYFRFPDEQQVVWPITLPPKDSAIIVWSQNPMKDTDRDSVADQDDACPETFVTTPARVNGCSFIQKTTQADLVVEITAPSVVNQDDSIAYTVTVTNQGPNTANNVSLAGLDGCVLSSATIVSGEIATCSTSVNAMDVGTLNQSVTVSADGYDNNKTNNTANATTSVQGVLTVMRSGTGSGSVTTDPAGISCGATCAAPFDANSTVILSATAANDSTFAGWAGCVANPDSTCTMTMDASKTVTANFVLKSYTLALSKTGTGSGTVTGDGTYTHGSTATVTAMANTGSTFTGWTGPDGAECATGSVSMTADKSCTATFTLNTYALTLTKTGTGSGTVTGDGTYNYGSTATVTATPSAGSAFDGWSGTNGTECATGSVSMTADKGCTATFTLLTFKNPSGNAAQTGGDNNGYQTTPGNAYAYDTAVAIDTNSGSNTNTSCTNTGKDKHSFYNYGFSIPVGAAIKGIEVKLNAKADSTSGSPKICVQLSWDGGTTWTTAKNTATLTTALVDYTLGTSADTWGHAWSVTELGDTKFKVRVIDVSSNTSRDFSLNYVGVKVTY